MEKIWKTNIKNQLILVLSIFAAVGMFQLGIRNSLPQLVISVTTAIGLDSLIIYKKLKKPFFSTSALISGLIIALALPPGIAWHIPLSAASIAIFSKHTIHIRGRHNFNPANFGLLLSMFIFGTYLAWWGATNTWLVLLLGTLITYRFKRIHLVLSFFITQSILLGTYFVLKGEPFLNSILMINLFFIFVMLIEPKTSPIHRKGRIIYGVLTGAFSSVLIATIPTLDPSVVALALSNLLVPVINSKVKE
ncbi:hypothetical protein GTN42_04470 [bacterium]|nr:hypothetical protein [bacterium]